jgi:predicted aconitase with swiveling domain
MALTLRGRTISKGRASGEALVCRQPIGFNFGVDVGNGVVTEYGHELFGRSIKDKVLLFPHGKGSTGGSYVVYQLAKSKTGPVAIINMTTETIIAVGAIMGGIPVIDQLEKDPYDLISDGDTVTVDATQGLVTIEKKAGGRS